MTPKEVLELAKKHDVKFVDLKFIDFPGVWQHTTIPATRLEVPQAQRIAEIRARKAADRARADAKRQRRPSPAGQPSAHAPRTPAGSGQRWTFRPRRRGSR